MMRVLAQFTVRGNAKNFVNLSMRSMSTETAEISTEEDHVLLKEVGDRGLVILNRPKALNSVTNFMVKKIHLALQQWSDSKSAVIIKSVADKAFCAGGDVKSIALGISENGAKVGSEFFKNEYSMNHCLATYKKPIVALIHGIVMGGGVGLSVHGKYRVATETTLFAMPETAIGLCPDVGATYFLPRLQGKLGIYLALTGHRLRGLDVLHAGIATHYVPSENLAALTESLLASGSRDVGEILNEYQPKNLKNDFLQTIQMDRINECFSAATVEEIINRLKKDGTAWSESVLQLLSKMSPATLKVTKKAMDKGREMSIAECLRMEYRLSCAQIVEHDFYEGVRAVLIDKDQKPKWNPKSLGNVTNDHVDKIFEKNPPGGDLIL